MTTPRIEEISFEKYLEQVCFEANPTVLDDDMPDFFDDWLGSQDGEDYIRLAGEYAKSIYTEAHQAIKNELEEDIRLLTEEIERLRDDVEIARKAGIDEAVENMLKIQYDKPVKSNPQYNTGFNNAVSTIFKELRTVANSIKSKDNTIKALQDNK